MNSALLSLIVLLVSFYQEKDSGSAPYIVVLGIVQDGGYPHAGCKKECCTAYWQGKAESHYVSCLALIDPVSNQRFLFDCTPDFITQLHLLDSIYPSGKILDGIFLTHAHIGHYTGLMHLGKESLGTNAVPVYAMPRMEKYLRENGPWSQLVNLKNISLQKLKADSVIKLNERISVTPFLVPHRDEYSETVGYQISAGETSMIFIPDIDKWEKWNRSIKEVIAANDLIFIDGTFYKDGELGGRPMSEIPHPFIQESMSLLKDLSKEEKSKVHFIHLNHTNPALLKGSEARKEIERNGFDVVDEMQQFVFIN